jgi:hypothetical protein
MFQSITWINIRFTHENHVILDGLPVIVLATGPKVCGFKPSQEQQIFKGDKNL